MNVVGWVRRWIGSFDFVRLIQIALKLKTKKTSNGLEWIRTRDLFDIFKYFYHFITPFKVIYNSNIPIGLQLMKVGELDIQ